MGNASAQPYNPTGGAPQQSTNQSTMSQGLNTMFGGGSPFGMQQPSYGMQNPYMQQPQPMPQQQQPSYQSNPDYQAYQTQMNDLSRQMDDYVKKAPMYQQLQDLQGKMRGFQQPQGQMGMPPPDVAQETVGIGNFEQDQLDRAFGRPPRMGGYGPRGGYGGRMGGYGQPQPGMGLQALSSLMQGRRGGFGGQRAIPQMMDEFY